MSNTKHTPTPWRLGHTADSIVAGDAASDKPSAMYYGGDLVAESMRHHDRDFVLRACNSHDQLVTACDRALSHFETIRGEKEDTALMLDLRRALRKALGAA